MEPELDRDEYRPPEASRFPSQLVTVVVVVLLLAAGFYAWERYRAVPDLVAAPAASAPPAPAEPPPPAAPDAAQAPPAIEHPVEPAEEEGEDQKEQEPLPALADAGPRVNQMLERLIGRKNVLSYLQIDGFLQHAVATVDNLTRPHAPVTVWPVNPTPQRFTTLRNSADGTETNKSYRDARSELCRRYQQEWRELLAAK